MPEASRFKLLKSVFLSGPGHYGRDVKVSVLFLPSFRSIDDMGQWIRSWPKSDLAPAQLTPIWNEFIIQLPDE